MPAPVATSAATSAATKGAGAASAASAIGEAGATVISAISQINDATKRRKFEQNFSQLTLEQQKGLEIKLIEAKNQSQKLAVLSEYLTQLNTQRIANLANFYSDKEKSKRTMLLVLAGGIAVLAIVTLIVIKKK